MKLETSNKNEVHYDQLNVQVSTCYTMYLQLSGINYVYPRVFNIMVRSWIDFYVGIAQ